MKRVAELYQILYVNSLIVVDCIVKHTARHIGFFRQLTDCQIMRLAKRANRPCKRRSVKMIVCYPYHLPSLAAPREFLVHNIEYEINNNIKFEIVCRGRGAVPAEI